MYLPSILALSIASVAIWSEPKNVAAECFKSNYKTMNCSATCYDETLAFVIESVTNIWNENHEYCTVSGMSLALTNIDFPNNTVYEGWLNPDIFLNYFTMSLANVDKIETNAFNSNSFFTVKELDIRSAFKLLDNRIFNGFTSLTTLSLSFFVLPELITTNVLTAPSETLKKFRLYAGGTDFINPKYNIFKLDNITGSGDLWILEDLSIQVPLNDSITRKSFVGLRNVVKIELEFCEITAIGRGSFDAIGPNLTSLRLSNNKITTLPNDLFKIILLNPDLKIYLAKNQWKCDCHLIDFQNNLIENRKQFDENLITCKSPDEKEFQRVTNTIIEQDEECTLTKECYSDSAQQITSGTVYIGVASGSISLVQRNTGDLIISTKAMSNVPTFIWYKGQEPYNDENEEEINCIQGFDATIESTFLSENIPYTFCYIEEGMTSTSPFNCISYIKVGVVVVPKMWYSENSKPYVITVIIVSLVVSLIFGIVGGMSFIKIKQRVIDYVYDDRTTTNKTGIEIATNQVPPLPERPKTLDERDPVYTYVG